MLSPQKTKSMIVKEIRSAAEYGIMTEDRVPTVSYTHLTLPTTPYV